MVRKSLHSAGERWNETRRLQHSEAHQNQSMYDGMSCGHIALDKLGAEVSAYYAAEIDKYAIQTTQHNYPETIQLGDAFQVREDNWELGHAQF